MIALYIQWEKCKSYLRFKTCFFGTCITTSKKLIRVYKKACFTNNEPVLYWIDQSESQSYQDD
jgi:hypothetical protein